MNVPQVPADGKIILLFVGAVLVVAQFGKPGATLAYWMAGFALLIAGLNVLPQVIQNANKQKLSFTPPPTGSVPGVGTA